MLIARRTPPVPSPTFDRSDARIGTVGTSLEVRRLLPHARRRQVGPWVFLDHFGPADIVETAFDVAPHPHIGLSTVTWVAEGEILHKDSLDSEQIIRPGQLNWMTAGRGISHSEETPPGVSGRLHGVQLWLALPESHRNSEPSFQHFPELPQWEHGGSVATVLAGTSNGLTSPARQHSPFVGLDVERMEKGTSAVALDATFEHAVMVIDGTVRVDGQPLTTGELGYLGMARHGVDIASDGRAKVLIVGGEPMDEDLVVWWNFVARTHDEVAEARRDWEAGAERFGQVRAYAGGRLPAPELP